MLWLLMLKELVFVLAASATLRLRSRHVQQACMLGCLVHSRDAKEVLQGQKQVSYAHRCFSAQENTEQWPWEAVVLIGWLIFFRYMVYIALRYKTAAPEAKHH